jgi:hypothetical protein
MSDVVRADRCPYCKKSFAPEQRTVTCSVCGTTHHAACWAVNGRCTTPDCPGEAVNMPEVPPQLVIKGSRPGALTAVIVIFFVLAGFTLFGVIQSVISLAVPNPALEKMGMTPGDLALSMCSSIVWLGVYLAFAIGLLGLRDWARRGPFIALPILFVLGSLLAYFNIARMIPYIEAQAAISSMSMIMWASFGIGILFNGAVIGLLLYLLSRKEVVAAFLPIELPPPSLSGPIPPPYQTPPEAEE